MHYNGPSVCKTNAWNNKLKQRLHNPSSNAGEKFPMKKDHAVPNHNSHSRNHHDAQAEKIRAETLPKLGNGSNVDLKKIRSHCLNCGKSNHKVDTYGVGSVDTRVYPVSQSSKKQQGLDEGGESKSKILNKTYKISQYHHLEDYDFPVNKYSLHTLNSFYSQNIVKQLSQQSQQHDVHKNINKLKEYVKDLYGIKLVPDTTVPIPKAVESEMKYKPQKIEFNTPTELTNVDDKNYTVNIFNNPKRLNSNKKLINDEEDELLYTIKFDKETNKPIISLLHSTGTSDTSLIPTLKCLIVPNKENMDKPKIIINSHSKEEQFKLILDTGSNVSLINKRLISKEMKNQVHKTKAKINFPLLEVKEEFVEQINIQVNNEIHTFFIIELDIIDVLFGNDILKDSIINQKDKIIKLNNSTYKINYQQSNQLHCNIKAPRKHVTVSNDNKSESHNLLEDDEDIKEQVTKFVESIPSQICDIMAKANPEEEEILVVRDFINDSFDQERSRC
ncbi:hypothetical protein ACTFIW_003315 [Dictyostelium discoideum]